MPCPELSARWVGTLREGRPASALVRAALGDSVCGVCGTGEAERSDYHSRSACGAWGTARGAPPDGGQLSGDTGAPSGGRLTDSRLPPPPIQLAARPNSARRARAAARRPVVVRADKWCVNPAHRRPPIRARDAGSLSCRHFMAEKEGRGKNVCALFQRARSS